MTKRSNVKQLLRSQQFWLHDEHQQNFDLSLSLSHSLSLTHTHTSISTHRDMQTCIYFCCLSFLSVTLSLSLPLISHTHIHLYTGSHTDMQACTRSSRLDPSTICLSTS